MTRDLPKRTYISMSVVPNTDESTLKNYLQSMGQEKPLIMSALKGFYMPAGMSLESSVSDGEITRVVLDSVWLLINQVSEIRRSAKVSRASLEVIDGYVGSMMAGICEEFGVTIPVNSSSGVKREVTRTNSQNEYGDDMEIDFKS
jgi:hypothetical protein